MRIVRNRTHSKMALSSTRIARSTDDSPTAFTTTPFHSLLFIGDNEEETPDRNHLPLQAPTDLSRIEPGPVQGGVDANVVELRIFFLISTVFLAIASYFIIKAIIRTWKRQSADYTWNNTHNKQSVCKCMLSSISSSSNGPELTATVAKVEDDDEPVASTGPPTSSSGLGTVDSSDGSADIASTNPLLEILCASSSTPPDQPSPPATMANSVALINASQIVVDGPSMDAPILRHHRRHHHKRKVNAETSSSIRRKRSSNSSPPSPVFPRRRADTGTSDPASVGCMLRVQAQDDFLQRQLLRFSLPKRKRGTSLDAAEQRTQSAVLCDYAVAPKNEQAWLSQQDNNQLLISHSLDPNWLRQTWVDDDDAGSHSIPLSVATAPPDYFDCLNSECERQ